MRSWVGAAMGRNPRVHGVRVPGGAGRDYSRSGATVVAFRRCSRRPRCASRRSSPRSRSSPVISSTRSKRRYSVARCMLRALAAAATSPPCSSRPSSASISCAARRCGRARRSAAAAAAGPPVPRASDQGPAAELVVGGDGPLAGVGAERREVAWRSASGASVEAGEGRADAAVGAGLPSARIRCSGSRTSSASPGARRRRRGAELRAACRRRRPRSRRRPARPAQRRGQLGATPAVQQRARAARACGARARRRRGGGATGCRPPPPRRAAGLALGVGQRAVADDHPQEAEQHVAVADRQAAAPDHPELVVARHVDQVARPLQPEAVEPGDHVRRRLARQDRRRRTASASSGWALCASSRQRRSSTEIGRRISASRSSTISCRSATGRTLRCSRWTS